jgi:photosystem II protein
MNIRIEFVKGISETTLPIIKLTKSRNGKTGTATFIFIKPILFNLFSSQIPTINGIFHELLSYKASAS